MNYLIYIVFGVAPSLIWLSIFYRKDRNPEPKRMVLKVFVSGAIAAAILVVIMSWMIQAGIDQKLSDFFSPFSDKYPFLFFLLYNFIAVGLLEETMKFLVVRVQVFKNKEFDEPVDGIIYMIIAALGFAALENFLFLLPKGQALGPAEIISISAFRFVGAIFLHALSSGTVGYFLALSYFKIKKFPGLTYIGLAIAAVLHGLFNISIMRIEESVAAGGIADYQGFFVSFALLIIILVGLAFFVFRGFRKLNKIALLNKIHPSNKNFNL